jgi:chromate transporter
VVEVFVAAARLGVSSFGGPIAHLGYFREEYVRRRRWLGDREFADLVALCQFLPGPASSQVGVGIGLTRGGLPCGVAAWLGFTLPSTLLLVGFAALADGTELIDGGWLAGLKMAAVSVVALAVVHMARSQAPDIPRAVIAIAAVALALAWESALSPIVALAASGLVGAFWLRAGALPELPDAQPVRGRRRAAAFLTLFCILLALLPVLARVTSSQALDMADSFYRAGALVIGGGHVVLPLLEAEVVEPGWVSREEFVAGYGAAQAVPGPLFTFAAYLGYVMAPEPNGVAGAAIALIAIFLPGLLLVPGTLPFWALLRQRRGAQAALRGVSAGVVGILAAAFYDPVWTTSVDGPMDVAVAFAALLLLAEGRTPIWLVVVLVGLAGAGLVAWA